MTHHCSLIPFICVFCHCVNNSMSMVLIPSDFNIWFKIASIFFKGGCFALWSIFYKKSFKIWWSSHSTKISISAQVVDQEVCQSTPPPQINTGSWFPSITYGMILLLKISHILLIACRQKRLLVTRKWLLAFSVLVVFHNTGRSYVGCW